MKAPQLGLFLCFVAQIPTFFRVSPAFRYIPDKSGDATSIGAKKEHGDFKTRYPNVARAETLIASWEASYTACPSLITITCGD